MSNQSSKRVESLDYLRGLMALSIMLYHYYSWSFNDLNPSSLLAKLGIYGVSIFYILSGLSLSIAYNQRINSKFDILTFFIKRFFRIFPLFFVVLSAYILLKYAAHFFIDKNFDLTVYEIFINYTLLFSFFDPSAYIPIGAWSIGNEIVFYTITPFVFYLSTYNKKYQTLFIIISLIIGLYISFFLITPSTKIEEQWSIYINPFCQLYLFSSGVFIGSLKTKKYRKEVNRNSYLLAALLAFILFALYPIKNTVNLIFGFDRLILSTLCIFFVAALFFANKKINSLACKPLLFFGESCYSIYLLHPIIGISIATVFNKISINEKYAYLISIPIVVIISSITFITIEKPAIIKAKKISKRIRNKITK